MLTPLEREVVRRAFTISIWNYRKENLAGKGKLVEEGRCEEIVQGEVRGLIEFLKDRKETGWKERLRKLFG